MLLKKSPAMAKKYRHDHARQWSSAAAPFDGYASVTREYNDSKGGADRNAVAFLYYEGRQERFGD